MLGISKRLSAKFQKNENRAEGAVFFLCRRTSRPPGTRLLPDSLKTFEEDVRIARYSAKHYAARRFIGESLGYHLYDVFFGFVGDEEELVCLKP